MWLLCAAMSINKAQTVQVLFNAVLAKAAPLTMNVTRHLTCCCSAYVECIPGGIFEWNTVDDTLVQFFANVTGYITAALGDDWILVSDAANNLVTMLLPQGAEGTLR